jgi:pseudouridine-5'-phosphate glycosidase
MRETVWDCSLAADEVPKPVTVGATLYSATTTHFSVATGGGTGGVEAASASKNTINMATNLSQRVVQIRRP